MTSGDVRVRAEIPGAPAAVRAARRLLATTLEEWGLPHLVEHGTLLVSELVTNAILHARSDVAVEVRRDPEVVRVLVHDAAARPPERRRHGPQAVTGRGLGLVEALSLRWGTDPAELPWRKSVWFELPVDEARLPPAATAGP